MDVSASAGSPCPQFSVKRMEPPSVVSPMKSAPRNPHPMVTQTFLEIAVVE
jgi:hypothetical protein